MIRILIVDDDSKAREQNAAIIAACVSAAEIKVCETPEEALAEAGKRSFDIAFLDIEMPGMNGLELAGRIKRSAPETNIIFSTAHHEYAEEAFAIHASGYVFKPLTREKALRELSDLRHPLREDDRGLRIQAFGNFEVFYNGMPLRFRYNKTKELLAYLVDRNCAVVEPGEIRATLWDDDYDRTSYIKQLRKDLIDTLKAVGAEDAVISVRGGIGVVNGRFRCDYFDYLAGRPEGINAYHGEYMQQYSWSEVTHGSLENHE